ncbi:MAG: hypothetical protein JXA44_02430 [Methanospirillaceae archaeon]|nr:hypothetical protein [Methanospirillaceae archaeon]
MKSYLYTVIAVFLFCTVHGMAIVPPDITFEKIIGSAGSHDCAYWVAPVSDGGYILTGMTAKEENEDVWIVRTDSRGNTLWERVLTGSKRDYGLMITENSDGSFFAVGSSKSSDGDFVQNHGGVDIWAAWFSRDGDLVQMRQYGGNRDEEAGTGVVLPGGSAILSGYTSSADGDVSHNAGGNDVWLVSLNKSGDIVWEKTYGGLRNENADRAYRMSDGGYILTGSGSSVDAGLAGHHGGTDLLLIRTDAKGDPLWQRYYGGSRSDWGHAVIETSDGNLFVVGTTSSDDGDVHSHYGAANTSDLWAVLLSPDGTILWQKTFGGSYSDLAWDCAENRDGYLIVGDTYSFDGDLAGTGTREDGDIWLLQLSRDGTLLWDMTLGGSRYETGSSVFTNPDGSIVVVGSTMSPDGDISGLQGRTDAWLVRLDNDASQGTVEILQQTPVVQIFPGAINMPTDPGKDGIYEDINGNGRLDYQDLILFYNNIEWAKQNQPASFFDLNGNKAIEMQDIILLYREV